MLQTLIRTGNSLIQKPYRLPPHHLGVTLNIIELAVDDIEGFYPVQPDAGNILREALIPLVKRLQESEARTASTPKNDEYSIAIGHCPLPIRHMAAS